MKGAITGLIFLAVLATVLISSSAVMGQSDITSNTDRRQQFLDDRCIGICPKVPNNKVVYGSCSGTLPSIEQGGTSWQLLICEVPSGAQIGDRVVASAAVRSVPSPILVLSEILHGKPESLPVGDYIVFAFTNGSYDHDTPEQELTVSYMIFRE